MICRNPLRRLMLGPMVGTFLAIVGIADIARAQWPVGYGNAPGIRIGPVTIGNNPYGYGTYASPYNYGVSNGYYYAAPYASYPYVNRQVYRRPYSTYAPVTARQVGPVRIYQSNPGAYTYSSAYRSPAGRRIITPRVLRRWAR